MKKKNIITLMIVLFITIVIFISGSYAYWKIEKASLNANVITSKCFDLNFEENQNSDIMLLKTYPISDEEGLKLAPYIARLTNKCSNSLNYQVNLELLNGTSLNEKYVKLKMNQNNITLLNQLPIAEKLVNGSLKSYQLENGIIEGNSTKEFELRLWLDGDIEITDENTMRKEFISKVSITGSYNNYRGTYTEDILNGADPILKDGLIPVTIADDGSVYKADVQREWYSYRKKNWANAVILENETITYQNGEQIPEGNIESYFVWVPRYRYKIFNDGLYYELGSEITNNMQAIEIVFENKNTQAKSGTKKDEWLTHPAFTVFDTNGMWVGKFETGYKDATTTKEGIQNVKDTSQIQIKPNTYSWRGITLANMHENSYNYQRDYDSHMMKNTEWGAVAYLSHSIYGNLGRIRINNNSDYKTGYAAVLEPTCDINDETCNQTGNTENVTKPYNTNIGYLASTTGNISGIYDMSGGAHEFVMGIMLDEAGKIISGYSEENNSGFNGKLIENDSDFTEGIDLPNSKYYDNYAFANNYSVFHRRILGDATGELGPFRINENNRQISSWYQNEAWMPSKRYPYFVRGYNSASGIGSGIFAFSWYDGGINTSSSYRIVLAL